MNFIDPTLPFHQEATRGPVGDEYGGAREDKVCLLTSGIQIVIVKFVCDLNENSRFAGVAEASFFFFNIYIKELN